MLNPPISFCIMWRLDLLCMSRRLNFRPGHAQRSRRHIMQNNNNNNNNNALILRHLSSNTIPRRIVKQENVLNYKYNCKRLSYKHTILIKQKRGTACEAHTPYLPCQSQREKEPDVDCLVPHTSDSIKHTHFDNHIVRLMISTNTYLQI